MIGRKLTVWNYDCYTENKEYARFMIKNLLWIFGSGNNGGIVTDMATSYPNGVRNRVDKPYEYRFCSSLWYIDEKLIKW